MLKFALTKQPEPSKSGYEFKMLHSFDKRKEESQNIIIKHPDKVPVIIERSDIRSVLKDLDKHKYLFHKEVTCGQILCVIRKQIQLDASESIFLFIDNHNIPKTSDTIGDIYNKYHDKDGFLYITYSPQQTFGL